MLVSFIREMKSHEKTRVEGSTWLTKQRTQPCTSVRRVAWGQGSMLRMRECRCRRGKRKTSHLVGGLGPNRQGSGCQFREDEHYLVSNREPLKACEQICDVLEICCRKMNVASPAQYEQEGAVPGIGSS